MIRFYVAEQLPIITTHLGAEVFERIAFDGVDAEHGAWLDRGETARYCAMIELATSTDIPCCALVLQLADAGHIHGCFTSMQEKCLGRTEELFASTRLLNNLHKTWLQLLDGWNVVGEDTHLAGFGGHVDLDAA
jgi:hypothetical protein